MTVERDANIVPARIWDARLKGFRPMTREEQKAITAERVNGYHISPEVKAELLRRMKPASERVQ